MAIRSFQIFRAGRHTDSRGVAMEFSESDLQATAKAYEAVHTSRAPLVLGHPKDEAAVEKLGWVHHLVNSEGKLYAVADVKDKLVSLVRTGQFKNRSACFFTPNAPGNPAPGRFHLRHVGFLGKQRPAVKGMDPLNFAETWPSEAYGAPAVGVLTFSEAEGAEGMGEALASGLPRRFQAQAALEQIPGLRASERDSIASYVERQGVWVDLM